MFRDDRELGELCGKAEVHTEKVPVMNFLQGKYSDNSGIGKKGYMLIKEGGFPVTREVYPVSFENRVISPLAVLDSA